MHCLAEGGDHLVPSSSRVTYTKLSRTFKVLPRPLEKALRGLLSQVRTWDRRGLQ